MKIKTSLLLLFTIGFFHTAFSKKKPNILIYLADDMGYHDVGIYGAKVVKTPCIDSLGRAGMIFKNAFIASPACAPSRAALLTGLMPAKNGAEENHSYPHKNIPILTAKLQEQGYKIFGFGKIAHGNMNKECGFDYYHHDKKNLTKHVKEFFNKTEINSPVCLIVGDRRPHVPWIKEAIYTPEEVDLPHYFIDTKETREHRSRYYTDITNLDAELKEILSFSKEVLGNNLLTIFTSDHGGQWPFAKWNLYDDGIRTPLTVTWPGVIKSGSVTEAFVSWIDIFPTLLDITKAKTPDNLDGKSFAKVLTGKQASIRDVIFTTHSGDGVQNVYPIRSVRDANYKFILNLLPNCYHTNHSDLLRKEGAGAYWNSWDEKAKYDKRAAEIVKKYYQRPAVEFYDLKKDPMEQNNLANDPQYANEVEKYQQMIEQWMEKQGDKKTVFQNPYPTNKPVPTKEDFMKLQK